MKIKTDMAWECACGHIEYGAGAPDECSKCFEIDSFTHLPEELMREREKELAEDMEEEIINSKMPGLKKPKIKKSGRKIK